MNGQLHRLDTLRKVALGPVIILGLLSIIATGGGGGGSSSTSTNGGTSSSGLTWTLDNVTFDDGGIATGTFDYDASSNSIVDFNITVSGGDEAAFPPFTYDPTTTKLAEYLDVTNCDSGGNCRRVVSVSFKIDPSISSTNLRLLALVTTVPLTDAGGTIPLNTTTHVPNFPSVECYNCNPYREVVTGSLVAIASTPAPTPTPTDVPFQLFPAGYFSNGYTRTWQLSGSDTVGNTYTATATFTTGAQTTFNGQPAIPVQFALVLTNTKTGVPLTSTELDYYSTDPTNRVYLGATDSLGSIFTPISLNIIPQSATIGTSPINPIGTYSGSGTAATETLTGTWQLTNANNGLANLINLYTTSIGSTIVSSSTTTVVIDQQGNGQSLTYKLVTDTGVIVTLSGS
jgi:hypothetical protein